MENFSTPRRVVVPVAANLLTLLALVCTVWWSSAQRPADDAQRRLLMAGPVAAQAVVAKPVQQLPSTQVLATDDGASLQVPQVPQVAVRPALSSTTTLDRDALRTVGYVAGSRH